MLSSRVRRRVAWVVAIAVVLTLLGVGGLHLATKTLKTKVEEALGPRGEVAEIRVGLSAVELIGIRIKAEKGWPAAEELSARRVVIEPELRSLVSSNIRIGHIRVEEGYLSLHRRKDGKVLVLPSLLGGASEKSAGGPTVHLGGITLADCAVELYDATVRQPPLKLRVERVNASLGKIEIPSLTGRTAIAIDGVVKGVRHDGRMSIKGEAEFASRDSEISAQLRGVDLLAFQPYLIKAAETGVKKGTLDLDLKSTVSHNRLKAPGSVTLSDMELSSGGSFMGLPRATVVSALKDKNGR
ncbi:MAG: DUF748 domain-containing protein, partial [Betaproteobacteria bacterium]